MVTLRVYRFDPDSGEEGHFATYDVPYEEGMRVLDGLHYIHDHLDGTLAFRWVCRAGQCGSCGIRINGKAGLACQEPLQGEGETTLEPLMLFPVVKDLVVDFGEGYRRLYESEPYLSREEPMADPPALLPGDVAPLKDFRSCIECWCCVSACPVANRVWDDYYGPIVMRKLCELDIEAATWPSVSR
jgi:fumarate reductase (CoM/CoB) subunit B